MKNKTGLYLLLKRQDFAKNGSLLSARDSAKALLNAGFWPLYRQTPCKSQVSPGQKALIYLAGAEQESQHVIASVTIDHVVTWSAKTHGKQYPLILDNEPSLVLMLKNIVLFDKPVSVKAHLDKLDFVPKNRSKWGASLIGGMKSLSMNDYQLLSTQPQ